MLEWLDRLMEAARQHLSAGYAWTPWMTSAAVIFGAVIVLLKGARLVRWIISGGFLVAGGWAGAEIAHRAALPFWPTMLITAAVAVIVGALLARLWLAVMLAGCAAGGSLALYYAKVLDPVLRRFNDEGVATVTLAEPGEATTALGGIVSRAQWEFLSANVSHLQMSLMAIVISTMLAGLVFGLLLPRFSRAVSAATAGTLALLVGVYGLSHLLGWQDQLLQLGSWTWFATGGVWLFSLLYNLLDEHRATRRAQPKGDADEAAAAAEPAPSS